jgi:hypothetical protein
MTPETNAATIPTDDDVIPMSEPVRRVMDLIDDAAREGLRVATTRERREVLARYEGPLKVAMRGLTPGQKRELDRVHVEHSIRALQDKILELLRRIKALEERAAERSAGLGSVGEPLDIEQASGSPVPRWAGVWELTRTYSRGALVCHSHSLFLAERAQSGVRPGTGAASGWRLVVKAPADLRPRSPDRDEEETGG